MRCITKGTQGATSVDEEAVEISMTVVEFEQIYLEIKAHTYQDRLKDPTLSSIEWATTYREWQTIAEGLDNDS